MVSVRQLRDRAIIRPIKRAVEDRLLDLPGVVAVDIGDKRVGSRVVGEQAVVVSVAHKLPDERLAAGARIPTAVLGVPTDVVEERIELHRDERGRVPVRDDHHIQGATAVFGGEGVAPARAFEDPGWDEDTGTRAVGTMGALAVGAPPCLVPMGLTTFDVACMDDAWSVGDRMIDPGTGVGYGDLARATLSSRVDAAAVAIDSGVRHGGIVPGIGPLAGHSAARPGETVRKTGFGTSFTSGLVASTDTTIRVDHGRALGVRVLREQVRVAATTSHERFAGPGDSGAVLVNVDGHVVGLHVAGTRDGATGFACPIADVLTELDVGLRIATRTMEPQ